MVSAAFGANTHAAAAYQLSALLAALFSNLSVLDTGRQTIADGMRGGRFSLCPVGLPPPCSRGSSL